MNLKGLANRYWHLTPEERFELILAAGGRGDHAEQNRLLEAGGRIVLSMKDHAPFAHAIDETARFFYLELLEEVHRYREAFHRADHAFAVEKEDEPDSEEKPHAQRCFDLALATGYVLRTKVEAWRLFCRRRHVPPFALWRGLPGFERMETMIKASEQAAFVAEGFLSWLNDLRPAGDPELTSLPVTAEGIAQAIEESFQARVRWWSGESRQTG